MLDTIGTEFTLSHHKQTECRGYLHEDDVDDHQKVTDTFGSEELATDKIVWVVHHQDADQRKIMLASATMRTALARASMYGCMYMYAPANIKETKRPSKTWVVVPLRATNSNPVSPSLRANSTISKK